MTLYLKYRSQTLDELDLTTVRETLKKIVASGNLPHAFLFAGPKGTGKTSSARILAKIINCTEKIKPCNKCEQCLSINRGSNLDVIELDAASHRGIDDVRSLRDAVKLSPAKADKKIYIIDEAHMLTTEAGNALLKTLEEPPDHVVFILATTNPEKLLETVRSRTTLVNFQKATKDEIVRCLERIVKGEKLDIKKDVLETVAEVSTGSFRDAVKTLEQLILESKTKDSNEAREFLFHTSAFDAESFLNGLLSKDIKDSLINLDDANKRGVSTQTVVDELLRLLRDEVLASAGIGKPKFENLEEDKALYLIELLTKARFDLKNSPIEQLPLEIALIKFGTKTVKTVEEGTEKVETSNTPKIELSQKPVEVVQKIEVLTGKLEGLTEDVWKKILNEVRPINASVEALLRSSKPLSLEGNVLKLAVFYKFHKERLEQIQYRKILEGVLIQVLGNNQIRVDCVLTEPPQKIVVEEKKESGVLTESADNDIIDVAEKIFGS